MQELINPFGRVYLTEDNIKSGAIAYTNALAEAKYNCVLNDTRLILGSWNHSLKWVLNDWAPRASQAGLKHFAMITTPETFAESTASAFYAKLKSFRAQVFDSKSKAEDWLRQYSLGR